MSGSFGGRHKRFRGPQARVYTVTGWSVTMNFVADWDASARCQTHSAQIAVCNVRRSAMARRTRFGSFVLSSAANQSSPFGVRSFCADMYCSSPMRAARSAEGCVKSAQ
jgi:hypothetical protein